MGEDVFRMPDVGEGIAEAEVVTWLVAVGDTVSEDQPIVEVMTDKATIEIASPIAGSVTRLGGAAGDTIAIGAELISFDVPGSDAPASSPPVKAIPPPSEPERAAPEPVRSVPHSPQNGIPASDRTPGRPLASPSVRRLARDAGVDLWLVTGTGPGGRIDHDDLERFVNDGGKPTTRSAADTTVTTIKVIGLRRRIAEQMTIATSRIPHITYVEEIDVTELEGLRRTLNERHPGRAKLTLLPFLMLAMVRSIAAQPTMNSRFDDEAGVVHQHGGVHIGVATQTQAGLLVPVVRHVETLRLWDCASEVQRVSKAARDGHAAREDLSGSTITVTSLGTLGGVVTTPVINHPEVAIVGVNKIQTRPSWDGTDFVPRQMMNLSSSFDHRIIDGWDAAMFIQRIKQLLEQPATIFIDGA